jgi:hypothetical protein
MPTPRQKDIHVHVSHPNLHPLCKKLKTSLIFLKWSSIPWRYWSYCMLRDILPPHWFVFPVRRHWRNTMYVPKRFSIYPHPWCACASFPSNGTKLVDVTIGVASKMTACKSWIGPTCIYFLVLSRRDLLPFRQQLHRGQWCHSLPFTACIFKWDQSTPLQTYD